MARNFPTQNSCDKHIVEDHQPACLPHPVIQASRDNRKRDLDAWLLKLSTEDQERVRAMPQVQEVCSAPRITKREARHLVPFWAMVAFAVLAIFAMFVLMIYAAITKHPSLLFDAVIGIVVVMLLMLCCLSLNERFNKKVVLRHLNQEYHVPNSAVEL